MDEFRRMVLAFYQSGHALEVLGSRAADQNISVVPCTSGQFRGQDDAVRIFDVQHIKEGVNTKTTFEYSHLQLNKWIFRVSLMIILCENTSSMQLVQRFGITQKSAWFMLLRIWRAV